MKVPRWSVSPLILVFVLIGISLLFAKTAGTLSLKSLETRGSISTAQDDYLLVRLGNESRTGGADESRIRKNAKFDNWAWVRPQVGPDASSVTMMNDWQVGLPALPVKQSDAVIVGTVKSGKAFLSNDETGIYSEFFVSVGDWLKGSRLGSEKSELIIHRAGGRILYPSGNILTYSISGQTMPRLNGKYVFFLVNDKSSSSFNILTAYGIDEGVITPLDGRGRGKVAGYNFSEYEGVAERTFLVALERALGLVRGKNSEGNLR
jgi:hypothetical protein